MADGRREGGIELLRILAMLMIVIGHVPHFYDFSASASGFALALLANGGRLAVNLFLLVGVWFLVKVEFRAARLLKLYFSVLCYALPLTVVAGIAGYLPPMREVVRCFFPLLGRPLWFISAYMTLLLLSPFLARARHLSRAALRRLVVLMAVCVCGVCSLPDPQLAYFGDTVWFVAVYLFMVWFKRAFLPAGNAAWRWFFLFLGLLGYVVLVGLSIFGTASLSSLADQYLFDFKTLPNFLVSLCIFIFFVGLKLGPIAWIDALARPSLAVYVFHQMPSFIPLLWGGIFPVMRLSGRGFPSLWLVAVAIGVYAVATVLEAVRLRFVEPILVRSRIFDWICCQLEAFYAPLQCGEGRHG